MCRNVIFEPVINTVKNTVYKELKKLDISDSNFDVVVDTKDCFRIIIEFNNSMGEIIVDKPDFAPYRYVSINILSSITDNISSIFVWYDAKDDSLIKIEENIRKGIRIAYEY